MSVNGQNERHILTSQLLTNSQNTSETYLWSRCLCFGKTKKFHCPIITTFSLCLLHMDNLTSGIPLSDQVCKSKYHHIPTQCSMLRVHRELLSHVFFILSSASLNVISSLLAFTKVKESPATKKCKCPVMYWKSAQRVSKQPSL